jgi:hypothetical protein
VLPGGRLSLSLPSPRSAAVGVLAMLAFGVIVGSFAPRSIGDLASAPLLLVVHPLQEAGAGGSGAGSSDGAGGGGTTATAVTQTVTQTVGGGGGGTSFASGGTTPVVTRSSTSTSSTSTNILGLPPIKHVFVIVLSGQGYARTFSPGSSDAYLSKTLVRQGALLADYYAVAGSSLANGIALLSGQGPTAATSADCPTYAPLTPAKPASNGQYLGQGCILPKQVPSLPSQLAAQHLSWRAYIQAMDAGPKGQPTSCRHPAPGAADPYFTPRPTDPYVDARNPVAYFASITGASSCTQDDVGLGRLSQDLSSASATPAFSLIIPDRCHDGSDQPCAPGAAAGLRPADGFVQQEIAAIEASPAYKADGLIAVTFDQAPQTGPLADPSACCSTPPYPNLPPPSSTSGSTTGTGTGSATTTATPATTTGTSTTTTSQTSTSSQTSSFSASGGQTTPTGGGGQVGLVLISRYIKPGTADFVDYYNHFSLLASIENIFGLKKLGYAAQLGLPALDAGVFNQP